MSLIPMSVTLKLQAPCSVLKAPNAENHSVQMMIDELFDPPPPPPPRPLVTGSTKRSMSAMIDELFDPHPHLDHWQRAVLRRACRLWSMSYSTPHPHLDHWQRAVLTKKSMSVTIDELFDPPPRPSVPMANNNSSTAKSHAVINLTSGLNIDCQHFKQSIMNVYIKVFLKTNKIPQILKLKSYWLTW
jgi:hypothetical protein